MSDKTTFSQQGRAYEFDVLIIGSGLAGLHCALQLLEINPNMSIALISKVELGECNSRYAQGGIAAAILKEDSLASHISDTLKAGDGLCYEPAVEAIISQGPEAIEALKAYQVPFSKDKNGQYALAKEGGHSHRRIVNAGDQTGLTITETLLKKAKEKKQITFFEQHIAVNLITYYHPHRIDIQGEVLGAYVLDCNENRIHSMAARTVILATGGSGKTYRYTTNPMVATGDGVAMAYRAGARVGNMEFYQFHPTLLYHPSFNNFSRVDFAT